MKVKIPWDRLIYNIFKEKLWDNKLNNSSLIIESEKVDVSIDFGFSNSCYFKISSKVTIEIQTKSCENLCIERHSINDVNLVISKIILLNSFNCWVTSKI